MKITKYELKTTIKTIVFGVGTWLIALPLRDKLVDIFPIKNTLIIGAIVVAIVLLWD